MTHDAVLAHDPAWRPRFVYFGTAFIASLISNAQAKLVDSRPVGYNAVMTVAQGFLIEFNEEMKNTRRMLERVPDEAFDYKPHPKSWTMGRLASHIAEMPGWSVNTVQSDELDLQPPNGPEFEEFQAASQAKVLEFFDKGVAEAKEAVARVSDEAMYKDWTLLMHGSPIFTMPRIAVLKSMILSHIIHHRAQLSVYLRMNDVPVPGMYGPSADER